MEEFRGRPIHINNYVHDTMSRWIIFGICYAFFGVMAAVACYVQHHKILYSILAFLFAPVYIIYIVIIIKY